MKEFLRWLDNQRVNEGRSLEFITVNMLHISRPTLDSIRNNGLTHATGETILKIAAGTGISPDELLGWGEK